MFCVIKTCNMFQNLVTYFDFSNKISKQLATHHHKSCCLGQDLQNELSYIASFDQKVKTCYMFSKTCYMFSPNTLFSNRRRQKQIFERPARSVWVLWGYNHSKYHYFDMGCKEKIFFEIWQ